MGTYYLHYHTQVTRKAGIHMKQIDITTEEMKLRKLRSDNAREMITSTFHIAAQDETSVITSYRGFYLQISFSEMHPLMVFCLAKSLEESLGCLKEQMNTLNLKSVLGSHFINDTFSCYTYRATHWLDTELTQARFLEILNRCCDEAARGYHSLTARSKPSLSNNDTISSI